MSDSKPVPLDKRDAHLLLTESESPLQGKPTEGRILGFRDLFAVGVNETSLWNGESADVFDIQGRVDSIALGGDLPPGALAIVAPREERDILIAILAAVTDPVDDLWERVSPQYNGVGTQTKGLPESFFILRPGEIVRFARPVNKGLSLHFATPWLDCGDWSFNNSEAVFPVPAPLLRVGYTPSARFSCPEARAVPAMKYIQTSITTIAGIARAEWAMVGPAINQVTIHIIDDSLTRQRIQGAESGSYSVWWMLPDGLWAHNEADDFDAGGRGVADATHDVEVYEIPRNARGVALVQDSGNDFWWASISTDGYNGAR